MTSQGCADAGVCYVPMESQAMLRVASAGGGPGMMTTATLSSNDLEVARLFQNSVPLVLGGFFVFGLLLAFTPCVLPMIPILSGIIAGEGRALGKSAALALSASYVLRHGGRLRARRRSRRPIQARCSRRRCRTPGCWAPSPWSSSLLALSMFGLYELQLPGVIHQRLDDAQRRLPGGKVASVAGMGALSARDRQSLRRGAARRRAALHRADPRRRAGRRRAVRHGARHGRAAARGRRFRGRAAAASRGRGWSA